MKDYTIKYQVPTYEIIMSRLKELESENNKNKFAVKNVGPLCYSTCRLPLHHYQIGHGPIHINIVGGTHGNEIISVDFVTQLMSSIAKGEGEFENFPEDEYTIDFIPIQNPEAFVISTTGISTRIKDYFKEEDIIAFCKTYWAAFREADILVKANKDISKSSAFVYQTMFEKADYNTIVPAYPYKGETPIEYEIRKDIYKKIRESVKNVIENYPGQMPPGYPIYWQATADGVNLNANNPLSINIEKERKIKEQREGGEFEPTWGPGRYTNIMCNVKGPIGVSTSDPSSGRIEPENRAIFNLLDEQIKNHQYGGYISFHGTAGVIFNRPSAYADVIDTQKRYHIAGINEVMAKVYKTKTSYQIGENGETALGINDPDFRGTDELLRVIYPGVLLVELSKMGGNPIAPYGDKEKNYIPTIRQNLEAFAELLKHQKELHPYIEDPNSFIIPSYDPETMEDKPLSR